MLSRASEIRNTLNKSLIVTENEKIRCVNFANYLYATPVIFNFTILYILQLKH